MSCYSNIGVTISYKLLQVMIIGSDNVFEVGFYTSNIYMFRLLFSIFHFFEVGCCSHSLKIGDHNVMEAK